MMRGLRELAVVVVVVVECELMWVINFTWGGEVYRVNLPMCFVLYRLARVRRRIH